MYQPRGGLVAILAIVLSSCCLWKPADPGGVLVSANAYGEIPAGAKVVSNRKFLRRVGDDKLKVLSPQRDREAELTQFQSDLQTLQAIPQAQRSPSVRRLLADAAEGTDPLREGTTQVTVGGQPREVRLLSLATRARTIVEAERLAVDSQISRAAYRIAYEAAPISARAGMPAPAALAASSLATIEEARTKLEAALWIAPALDEVRADDANAAFAAAAPEMKVDPAECPADDPTVVCVDTAGCPVNDGTIACGHFFNGLHKNFWWPLKQFVTPIRSQGERGTCWAFAAVAAIESRELVVNDEDLNLSEQYFVYRWKSTVSPSQWKDDDNAERALAFLASFPGVASPIPGESYWQYNPSCLRDPLPLEPWNGSCTDYTGKCSETVSQGPITCTVPQPSGPFGSEPVGQPVCAVEKFAYQGNAAVPVVAATQMWKSGQDLDLASLRAVLANGQPILASFDVYRGFQNPVNGFVTDYAEITNNGSKAGGHQILFVGFVSNDDLLGVLPAEQAALGGGYFIAKNSWSCSGDGGYYYLPVNYVKRFFSLLSAVVIPPERGQGWTTAKTAAAQAPKVQITVPFLSTDVALSPHRVDFSKEIALTAVANDVQDGASCCGGTFQWSFAHGGTHVPLSGGGATATLPAASLSGLEETRVQVTASDADGNVGKASLWLADIEPRLDVISPLPEQTYFTGKPDATFEARVAAEGVPDLDCSAVEWHTDFGGDPPVTGCAPSLEFKVDGDRNVLVQWTDGRHQESAKIPIHVVVPSVGGGPPKVVLALASTPDHKGNTVIRFSLLDPGGVGLALSQYTFEWQLEHAGKQRTIAPTPTAKPNEVLIHSFEEFDPGCVETAEMLVRLTVTDPETLSGTDTVTFTYEPPPCIN